MRDKEAAISYIYASYMKAQKHLDYALPDAVKRNPALSGQIIRKLSGTPAVVVTGSKGKGSVSYMLSQLLQTEKKTGLMTSPHIRDFNERFRVMDDMIGDERLTEIIFSLKPEFDQVEQGLQEWEFISPMGLQAATALRFFAQEKTQINIFECGKGVRYDDVNNIPHEYAVINTIFAEHTRELGKTIKEIAENKAAIITGEQRCVYVGEQSREAFSVIAGRAQKMHTRLKCYGRDFWYENLTYGGQGMMLDIVCEGQRYEALELPLLGEHQAKNLALAMAAAQDILGTLSIEACRERLRRLCWPGRLTLLGNKPYMVLDACINRKSAENVRDVLKKLPVKGWQLILGVPEDKDYVGVAEVMAELTGELMLVRVQNPHYHFSEQQLRTLREAGCRAEGLFGVEEALSRAAKVLKEDEGICILGTTALISEVYAGLPESSRGADL